MLTKIDCNRHTQRQTDKPSTQSAAARRPIINTCRTFDTNKGTCSGTVGKLPTTIKSRRYTPRSMSGVAATLPYARLRRAQQSTSTWETFSGVRNWHRSAFRLNIDSGKAYWTLLGVVFRFATMLIRREAIEPMFGLILLATFLQGNEYVYSHKIRTRTAWNASTKRHRPTKKLHPSQMENIRNRPVRCYGRHQLDMHALPRKCYLRIS